MTIMRILSLGAGVQSSTLALMAAHGEIEPVNHAIFADTQAEPASVYRWLDWLDDEIQRCPHPFPVYRVTKGSLTDAALRMRESKKGRLFTKTDIPFFTKSESGSLGKIRNRACTADYKIDPITKKAKELAGIKRGQKHVSVKQLIGISLDEAVRMKPSRNDWAINAWPLVELGMRRHDCIAWMESKGYPRPPRSSCVYCPFHNDIEWRRLKNDEPDEFQKAVEFERKVQAAKTALGNFSSLPFLHRSCVPLDEVDLTTAYDHGQIDMFVNECEGMCGV